MIEIMERNIETYEKVKKRKKKVKMRVTSLLAFQEVLENIGERQMQVLKCIQKIQPCTNLEISKHLKLPINSITPRCQELRKMGIVILYKKDICKYTGRKVIYWRIKDYLNQVMT